MMKEVGLTGILALAAKPCGMAFSAYFRPLNRFKVVLR